jgi:hypothetical protein
MTEPAPSSKTPPGDVKSPAQDGRAKQPAKPFPDWLDENQKLISVLGVFIAMGALTIQLVPSPANFAFGIVFAVMALLVLTALVQRAMANSGDLRTGLLSDTLAIATIVLFAYIAAALGQMALAVTTIFALTICAIAGVTVILKLHRLARSMAKGSRWKLAANWVLTVISSLIVLAAALVCTALVVYGAARLLGALGKTFSLPDTPFSVTPP